MSQSAHFPTKLFREDDEPWRCLPAQNWGWFALRAALSVLLGIFALIWPGAALFAFATVFAAFALVDGIFALVSGVRGARRRAERWVTLVLAGVVGIAIGVIFLFFPLLATVAYAATAAILIASWAILTGGLEIAAAIRLRREITGEWLLMLSGALSVLLGAALLFMLLFAPGAAMLSVIWLVGLYALMGGIALAALAYRLWKRQKDEAAAA